MSWLRTAVREVFGLFVDDGSYALAILIWLGLAWLVLPRVSALGPWSGALLFGGLAGTLAVSAMVRARR
ncbi:hypothetical protein D3273_14690 [Lichenibacterium minor]|uniref:Uncharacterized protein n=1 Tax=Lichenibacterium minor TaxID=2316528 RepID=A0A4Q2U8P8_9HYPH|nr:hypothetical protein [Lichenibacterium minor]MBE7218614.1 hypothetical protein [Caulobacter sp.]RYC31356.1 hypothetical protein D3273_14690 [Lichenibacterium minor]